MARRDLSIEDVERMGREEPGSAARYLEERRAEIEAAGYEMAQALDYAPHAAWVRARSGRIADALNGLRRLEAIPDVENVEPQMLTPRAAR